MKTRAPRIAATNILLGISVLLVSSCTQHYFQYPQPVDRKNTYRFPKAFRGTWEPKEDTTTHSFSTEFTVDTTVGGIPPASDTMVVIKSDTSEHKTSIEWPPRDEPILDSSFFNTIDSASLAEERRKDSIHALDLDTCSIKIKRKFIQIIIIRDERVDTECVLIAGTKEDEDLRAYYEEYHRSTDSVAEPIGKKATHYLKGDLIYDIQEGRLNAGHKYETSGKEFIIHRVDTVAIELGHYAFLRKLNKTFWVLNLSSQQFGDEGWWSIYILEKTGRRTLRVWECDTKLKTLSMFSTHIDYANSYYFDHRWPAEEMLQLIQQGYFTRNDFLYERL